MKPITGTRYDWSALGSARRPTLLHGNGASINVWHRFSYTRLHDEANLNPEAPTLFEGLATANFEAAPRGRTRPSLSRSASTRAWPARGGKK